MPDIKMYALSTCSHCKAAKQFLEKHGIEFHSVNVDHLEGEERKETISNLKKLNPRCSFPTLIIDEDVIVGFKEKEIREALNIE